MANEVIVTSHFEARYKRLAKKFRSLEADMDNLIAHLIEKPTKGQSLGAGLYKIRLAVESRGGGKSGGFRVITYLVNQTTEATDIYLVTIYDKSEESSINKGQLTKLVKEIFD
ncbi:type II toxin-antitoxin system RelE/ParE family toxin [Emticicia sp. TH156]|uniref:type II toxin-antitoxin system RelE/ParE family toxin n=1 Tax=Emticicia sp. TH156 TaxID=2067454 RepID=UPI000C76DF7D|nr:type II toxin-antitoxin system RelE/ParE family toxin [Emticicia sp. TH156]PLK43540.1 addiction module toxin RelE [Emticicia sp. TH156]